MSAYEAAGACARLVLSWPSSPGRAQEVPMDSMFEIARVVLVAIAHGVTLGVLARRKEGDGTVVLPMALMTLAISGDAHLLPQPVHIGDNALGGRNCGAFCDKRSGLRVEGAQRIRILMDIDADRSYNFIAIHEVISFACGKARLFGLDHGIAESTILQIRGHFILFIPCSFESWTQALPSLVPSCSQV